MNQLTPRQIVAELDKYIIGQDEAKRAVAIALRNRFRRSRLAPEVREEITPKNILMSSEARMNSRNSGCALLGRDLNSGWNCTPM